MIKKRKVLEGHKKVGSKFIPPMMQIPLISEISYVNQILPEIIWMGLISNKYGYRQAIDLVFDICQKAFELKETDSHINFTIVSNFDFLSRKKKEELINYLISKSTFCAYQEALLPLTKLYKECPISFLEQEKQQVDRKQLVVAMKKCINNHFDKYDTPSLVIQANVVHIRNATGGLHIAQHIEAPDLNSIIDAPESDAAMKASSFVRTSIMSELSLMSQKRYDKWAKSFWNQGYTIDKCDFSREPDELD